MIQKIKILKLQKPEEYIKKELSVVKSLKNKLLKSSDWTQLIDSGLSVKNILQWRFWRNSVRILETDKYEKLLEIKELIQKLDNCKPQIIKRSNEHFKYPLIDFNYSSLEAFKHSCILIGKECKIPMIKICINDNTTIEMVFTTMIKEFK